MAGQQVKQEEDMKRKRMLQWIRQHYRGLYSVQQWLEQKAMKPEIKKAN